MYENFRQPRRLAGANLPVHTLAEVNDARPDGEPPAEVPKAMLRRVERKIGHKVWLNAITHKASRGMGIKANHEEERQVMGVPERLEALLTDLVVRGGVHEYHDEEHEVTSETTRLSVVNLLRALLSNLYEVE